MKSFLAALQFFTVVPVKTSFDTKTIGESLAFLPVVGIVIGAITSLIVFGASYLFSAPVITAFIGVVALIWMTGGLHLDGVADSFDGLWSARSKERVLEIMRDSRIGSMGVLGLVIVLGLKLLSLSTLNAETQIKALLLAPIIARSILVFVISLVPYAREEGMAKVFCDYKKMWHLPFVTIIAVASSYLLLGSLFWLPLLFGFVGAALINLKAVSVIGGMTGDVAGASCEIAEAFVFLSFCVVWL